jgi:hypothetical protein
VVTLEAKNVVLARVHAREGRAEVLESWRGDLAPGTQLSLPDVAVVTSDSRRLIYVENRPTRDGLDGERMVLFVSKKDDKTWAFARNPLLSLLIIERRKVWAPSLAKSYQGFGELGLDESELRARISVVGAWSDELAAATKIADLTERARALAPLAVTSYAQLRWRALREMRACGALAAPTVVALVRRESNLLLRGELLALLNESAHASFVVELRALLADDARFWKRIGPGLEDRWWNGAGTSGSDETEYLKARWAQTRTLLCWARQAVDPESSKAASHLREVWNKEKHLGLCLGEL